MTIAIHVQDIKQTVDARDAEEALSMMKDEAATRAPFLLRAVINSLSDANFAAEVVKRANASEGRQDPIPQSAQEFLDWAVEQGYATILKP